MLLQSSNPPLRYVKYQAGSGWEPVESRVIRESPVSLTVNGEVWLTFMCTPADLEALAVGFLFNEGLIRGYEDVASARPCQNNENIDVWLHQSIEKPTQWRRTSGCSGGQTRSESSMNGDLNTSETKFAPEILFQGMQQLLASQELYREARGVHCSALSDGQQLLLQAEDIGRHNTLDKLVGRMLIEGIQPEHRIIFTTGRISSEMLQKSVRIGASVIVSRTSPTSLSVETAEAFGITLVGYARRNQFNVYTHPGRLMLSEVWTPAHQMIDSGD
jgi:FdhD protein